MSWFHFGLWISAKKNEKNNRNRKIKIYIKTKIKKKPTEDWNVCCKEL
jgi:hypothetical protein